MRCHRGSARELEGCSALRSLTRLAGPAGVFEPVWEWGKMAAGIGAGHGLVSSIAVVSRSPLSSTGPLRAHSLVASSERGC